MIVTINTDASFSNKYHIGTYAFWIACDKGKFFRSGALKGNVYSSLHAEMKCIINALNYVLTINEFKSVKKIIINTDCLFAINKFQEPNKSWSNNNNPDIKKELQLINTHFKKIYSNYFSDKPEKRKILIEYKHLKSHQHTDNPRHFVNDMCDKEAKKQMGILLKKIVNEHRGN